MQYKIPVQIENEDPIFLGLSLRQLFIMMIGGGIAYLVFKTLAPSVGGKIAFLPAGVIGSLAFAIAVFKVNEMTFIPFVLSSIRLGIFPSIRQWYSGIDSFQPIDIGYLTGLEEKKMESVDVAQKLDTMQELQEKLKKI